MGDETRVAADRSQRREGRPSLKIMKVLGGSIMRAHLSYVAQCLEPDLPNAFAHQPQINLVHPCISIYVLYSPPLTHLSVSECLMTPGDNPVREEATSKDTEGATPN